MSALSPAESSLRRWLAGQLEDGSYLNPVFQPLARLPRVWSRLPDTPERGQKEAQLRSLLQTRRAPSAPSVQCFPSDLVQLIVQYHQPLCFVVTHHLNAWGDESIRHIDSIHETAEGAYARLCQLYLAPPGVRPMLRNSPYLAQLPHFRLWENAWHALPVSVKELSWPSVYKITSVAFSRERVPDLGALAESLSSTDPHESAASSPGCL